MEYKAKVGLCVSESQCDWLANWSQSSNASVNAITAQKFA